MKSRIITTIALVLIFLVGLSVLSYPMVSDYVNSRSQSRVIANYEEKLLTLSAVDYSDLLEAAREYNQRLLTKQNRFMLTEAELDEYYNMLNFTGSGVIGTLEIDAIKLRLPLYLGTKESVLQIGIGHLEGSSLPIGGPSTHSVISGHRGLPSSTLLTNADQLIIGDIFILRILNEVLVYQINQIKIVEPDDVTYLGIEEGKDYCTLFTCTPYGINSHRLLLRGERILPPEEAEENAAWWEEYAPSASIKEVRTLRPDAKRANILLGYVIAAAPIILIVSIYTFIKNRKSKKRR